MPNQYPTYKLAVAPEEGNFPFDGTPWPPFVVKLELPLGATTQEDYFCTARWIYTDKGLQQRNRNIRWHFPSVVETIKPEGTSATHILYGFTHIDFSKFGAEEAQYGDGKFRFIVECKRLGEEIAGMTGRGGPFPIESGEYSVDQYDGKSKPTDAESKILALLGIETREKAHGVTRIAEQEEAKHKAERQRSKTESSAWASGLSNG